MTQITLSDVAALLGAAILAACQAQPDAAVRGGEVPPAWVTAEVPERHRPGAVRFADHCESCHGIAGSGSANGPPLVDRVYRPRHHGDEAFQLAVARGVSAHHWRFGNMPPIPGLDRERVAEIVAYVRWLQRLAGVYD